MTPAGEVQGEHRGAFYERLPAPDEQGIPGAGTVYHVAWASSIEQHAGNGRGRWRPTATTPAMPGEIEPVLLQVDLLPPAGRRAVRDRHAGPRLREIDQPIEHLGERLSLPPDFEHLRDQLDGVLTPLPDARAGRVSARAAACASARPSLTAASAASQPLFPCAPPDRASACSRVLAVTTPKATGTPVAAAASVMPRAASAQT